MVYRSWETDGPLCGHQDNIAVDIEFPATSNKDNFKAMLKLRVDIEHKRVLLGHVLAAKLLGNIRTERNGVFAYFQIYRH